MKQNSKPTNTDRPIDPFVAYWLLRLEAKCDALKAHIVFMRKELNLPNAEKTDYAVEELFKANLQKKLERVEQDNPSLAAQIDRYRSDNEMPDEYL